MSFTVRRLKEEEKKPRFPWRKTFMTLLSVSGPAINWVRQWQAYKREENARKRMRTFLKRTLVILVALLIALLLVAGMVKGLMALKIITIDDVVEVAGTPPVTDSHGHINILLMGQGDAGHAGTDLTDTLIVASVDPSDTKSVVMLSLPRDIQITTELYKERNLYNGRKINSLYRDFKITYRRQGLDGEAATLAAMEQVAQEIGNKLGIQIDHAIKVDFVGFEKLVDTLGGIEIDVPADIVDTEYPDNDYGYETFRISAGLQTLDGATALKYARSRHSTSDFDRSARQQQIIAAMSNKASDIGLVKDATKIASISRVLSEHVKTTLTLRELIGLAQVGQGLDRSNIVTMQLNDRNALYDSFIEPGGFLYTPPRDEFSGVSVLLPVSIPEFPVTWKQPQALVRLLFNERTPHLQRSNIGVLNAGAPSGSARRLGNELTRYGFIVTEIDNAPGDDQPTSTVIVNDEYFTNFGAFLQNLLDFEARPAASPEENVAPITIIVGEDYTYTPLQNLIPIADAPTT